jgi:hypothetical protein
VGPCDSARERTKVSRGSAEERADYRRADKDKDVAGTDEILLTPAEGYNRYGGKPIEEFAVDALLKFFREQTDNSLRAYALAILAMYNDPSVQELMASLAADPDSAIQQIAANYAPPEIEEDDHVHFTRSPDSGITPPEKAAEIERLSNLPAFKTPLSFPPCRK